MPVATDEGRPQLRSSHDHQLLVPANELHFIISSLSAFHSLTLSVILFPCGRINVKHRRYFPTVVDEKQENQV